jgi:hypothetical protein
MSNNFLIDYPPKPAGAVQIEVVGNGVLVTMGPCDEHLGHFKGNIIRRDRDGTMEMIHFHTQEGGLIRISYPEPFIVAAKETP